MKLLILSNYFTPDLSAGSFRTQGLVEALESLDLPELEVDLLTTRPNRYASLAAEASPFEDRGWLRIRRVDIPAHRGGMADQALSYTRYVREVWAATENRRWDGVFATSSRLMTSVLGAVIARRVGAPLYLDIRDIFTDNMDELLAGKPIKGLQFFFRRMERFALREANRINVVSAGFLPHLEKLAPGTPKRLLTNGIDRVFLNADFANPSPRSKPPLIVYAGNMGEGQGLHRIVPDVAKRLEGVVRFRLIGDGGRKAALEQALATADNSNVELLPPVPREELLRHYAEADILFLHLNDLASFRKVLPSKLFEYAVTGKPILAGVAGHAAEFLAEQLPDAAVFDPLDAGAMVASVDAFIEAKPEITRESFIARYDRRAIMRTVALDLVAMLRGETPPTDANHMPVHDSDARG